MNEVWITRSAIITGIATLAAICAIGVDWQVLVGWLRRRAPRRPGMYGKNWGGR